MCASNTLVGMWATGCWTQLGSPPTLSALTLSGFAVQPGTLGQLSNKITVCYSGVGTGGYFYDASPDLTVNELAIIEGIFLVGWYNQLAFATMGAGNSTIPWARIREGDESIERANPVNIGQQYREMSKEANLQLNYLVGAYNDGQRGTAASVDFLNPAYPYLGSYGGTTNQRSVYGPQF